MDHDCQMFGCAKERAAHDNDWQARALKAEAELAALKNELPVLLNLLEKQIMAMP